MAWCAQYLSWTCDDWRNAVFSDGSSFYVLKRKDFGKICRLEKEKILPECLEQTNTGDDGKVGIRGEISGFGTTPIKLYIETMDSNLYCCLLHNELKQTMAKIPNKTKIIIQRDLAPWHT